MLSARSLPRLFSALKRFAADRAGNVALTAAIASVPLCIAATAAIDYGRLTRVRSSLQETADSAALAAASASNMVGVTDTATARKKIATNFVNMATAHLSDAHLAGPATVTVGSNSVQVSLKAEVRSTIGGLLASHASALIGSGTGGSTVGTRSGNLGVSVTAKAGWSSAKNYICMLALNSSAQDAISVFGTADIKSPNCSIQANSTSSSALKTSGNATVKAGSVAVAGSYNGNNITPTPKTGAAAFSDPLASQFATDYTAAYSKAVLRYSSNSTMTFANGTTTLQPGRYKSGMRIDNGSTVVMSPGIYIIDAGALEVRSGGVLNATGGVTIVLTGSNQSILYILGGGSINVKAPASGSFAGIAIAQHPSVLPSTKYSNTVIGGGQLNIEGIIYMPKQNFYVTGNGSGTVTNLSTTAKQFAIVADTITVQGNGQVNVGQSADYSAAGLPALPSQKSASGMVSLVQ